ncbi:MAG: isochorismatase family protein [Oscillospiraceae bacterium]|nr:isochorismatase family protein [Oscillospiraceae bacterium]
MYDFVLRTRQLLTDKDGFDNWQKKEERCSLNPKETAIVIIDMWDRHWCAGANARGAELGAKINETAKRAREKGTVIVHAPSDTMDFYKNSEARKRLLQTPLCENIPQKDVKDYPLPVDSSDGGSDTPSVDRNEPNTVVWKRQTEKIFVDESRDIVGEEGDLIYSYLAKNGVKNIIYMGVHTNMCVLGRPFAIKAMLRRTMGVMLCRDLTDSMYNPAKPPYVSHGEGTRLVVEYIEKFYCPTMESGQII